MESILGKTQGSVWVTPAAQLAIIATVVSGTALILLHIVSPEFAPSWRAVSEYANGQHKWLLTVVFLAWAASSFVLLLALRPLAQTTGGKVALVFLFLAGVGQTMGGLFDINHKLHGLAAMIGIPSLCITAVLTTLVIARRSDISAPPLWSAHLPWISFLLMIGSLMLFISSLRAAGIEVSADSEPLSVLPDGVMGYVGWANRLLFAASYLWVILTSVKVLKSR